MKRYVLVFAIGLFAAAGLLVTSLATSEMRHTGTSAGIAYDFTQTGLQGYSLSEFPGGFRYRQNAWFGLGRPTLEVAVTKGQLWINHSAVAAVNSASRLVVTGDHRVLLDGVQLRP